MPTVRHNDIEVHYRDTGAGGGTGATALLVHSAGATSSQWSSLTDVLAPSMRVLAPDLYGHGRTPEWPGNGTYGLDDEAALVETVAPADTPVHLIAHSFGASVALQVAKRDDIPLASLTLIDATTFGLLREKDQEAWRSMLTGGAPLVDMVAAGDPAGGAARFMDYLFGDGTWAAMPTERQDALVAVMPSISRATAAQIAPEVTVSAYAGIETRALLIYGAETPRDIRRTCEILAGTLPNLRVEIVDGASHMVPLTHRDVVNGIVREFVSSVD